MSLGYNEKLEIRNIIKVGLINSYNKVLLIGFEINVIPIWKWLLN